jgi:thioredoxin 1
MAGNSILQVGTDNWESEVISSESLVLVDFWAEWCGPCRAMNPILEELADELPGQLKVVKVNIDENQALAGEFGIRSIPTFLLVKSGNVAEQLVGALNKESLREKINTHL